VRTRFLGRRDRAPEMLQERMAAMEAETAANTRIDLWIAFDYGGRAELVEAARRLAAAAIDPEDIDEAVFAAALSAPELPDPDLVIRTSGERRISNFLLWQVAYSELLFVDCLWPDFGEDELLAALHEYSRRRRRFGGR
jgi:undecaprenyl diphosphate synthase